MSDSVQILSIEKKEKANGSSPKEKGREKGSNKEANDNSPVEGIPRLNLDRTNSLDRSTTGTSALKGTGAMERKTSVAKRKVPHFCCIGACKYSPPSPLFPVTRLKQRFKRILMQQYPTYIKITDIATVHSKSDERDSISVSSIESMKAEHFCCLAHLKHALQARADELVEEDLTDFSKFQDTIMKDLEVYELGEDHWQEQFYRSRSFSEKAADAVAKFGGSWGFIVALGAFILGWAFLNISLSNPWDAYPFILLNLILSMLASTQAPIIMMSQNRQAAIDRLQNDYVSRAILRNENQTRHVDAKLDHLISYQWKRLLEIQEIQIQLLQEVVSDYASGGAAAPRTSFVNRSLKKASLATASPTMGKKKSHFWSGESFVDPFTLLLLRKSMGENRQDDQLIFSRWHSEGDNYTGDIRNVTINTLKDHLSSISFDIVFSNKATLDDILQGEVNVTFRNDFNLSHMNLGGRIRSIRLFGTALPPSQCFFVNGEFPPRYKPTFVRHRPDRITDIWKNHFEGVGIEYTPTPPFCVVHVPEGMCLKSCSVSVFHDCGLDEVFVRVVEGSVDYRRVCFDLEKVLERKNGGMNEGVMNEGEEKEQGSPWIVVPVEEQAAGERIGVYPSHEINFVNEAFPFSESGYGDAYRHGISGPCTVLLAGQGRLAWQGVVERERVQEISRQFSEIDALKEELLANLLE